MFLDMFRVSLYTAVGAEACGDRKVAKEALDTAAKVILVAGAVAGPLEQRNLQLIRKGLMANVRGDHETAQTYYRQVESL